MLVMGDRDQDLLLDFTIDSDFRRSSQDLDATIWDIDAGSLKDSLLCGKPCGKMGDRISV